MDILRFATAGSVDDGKSTLIGRLLYDTKSVLQDQMDAVERVSRDRGDEYVNLALLTDGLRAEREQGITIDVAYRYFSTPRRNFIIADTPGHIQYTRNMVTGASTADLALVLVDARKGIVEQSRRHAFLATLLQVPHLVLCVNKMDLVDYVAGGLRADPRRVHAQFAAQLRVPDLVVIPVSALAGDNVVNRSENMPWYEGSEPAAPPRERARGQRPQPDRRPVPRAVRHPAAVRRLARLPRLRGPGRRRRAQAGRRGDGAAVRLHLPDRLDRDRRRRGRRGVPADVGDDPARGRDRHLARRHDLPAEQQAAGHPGRRRDDLLDGREHRRCRSGRKYAIKHTTRTARTIVKSLNYKLDINTLHRDEAATACPSTRSAACGCAPPSRCCATTTAATGTTGGFVLIDEATKRTVAAGMITEPAS